MTGSLFNIRVMSILSLSCRPTRVAAFVVGGLCAGGAALATLTAPPASAEPTGCIAGSAFMAAASYCSGGTGEHRVQGACLTSSGAATLLPAFGPWQPSGQISIVTVGAPTQGGSCVLPVLARTDIR